MIFPIPTFRSRHAVPSLGGGTKRAKPVVPLLVVGSRGQEWQQVLVDSGADDIVFPAALAGRIGIDLSRAASGTAQGVGPAQPVVVQYAPVIMVLTDNVTTCRWRAVVGFTNTPLRFPLFGIAGGWEHFRVTLDIEDGELEMLPKPSLPSTHDPVP